jgi:SSS family solute:Na+ symporter
VIAAYAAAVLVLGRWAKKNHESAEDLIVGRRSIPTWAVLGSMVATELSAATFLGVPDAAYVGTWSYLELAFGALLGKIVVSLRVIPLYHRLEVLSIYQLLEIRFGARAQRAAAGCFVVGRLLASGVRLFIAALAFAAVTGTGVPTAIVACGVIAGIYTRGGGIRSVIWTDILQAGVFLAGAVALLVAAAAAVPGGAGAIFDWALETGRAEVFTFSPLFTWADGRGFGTALIGGFFLTLATHGTDFDMVQRLLTARGGRAGGAALTGSALLNFPITALFLAVGTAIAAHYALAPPGWETEAGRVVPTYALNALPIGVRGLVFAGLLAAAMSSLDSAICAIATTWTVDFGGRTQAGELTEEALAARTRRAALASSVALVAAALGMSAYHALLPPPAEGGLGLVEFALSAMTILYGGLLGVFAVAIGLPGRGSERGAVAGLALGSITGLILFLHPILLGEIWLAWTWWIPVSASVAAGITLGLPKGVSKVRTRGATEMG